MRNSLLVAVCGALLCACAAAQPEIPFYADPEGVAQDGWAIQKAPGAHVTVWRDGAPLITHIIAPPDPENREATYKPFTHLHAFDGMGVITKGVGGRFSHHRGLYIGWNKTETSDRSYDTWHMRNCTQEHVGWAEPVAIGENESAESVQTIHWQDNTGAPFIREERRVRVDLSQAPLRIVDFESTLTALNGPIRLRGDLQHAGMQIRMTNELVGNEDGTLFVLPESAEELPDDEVHNAWWACGQFEIGGKHYSVLHMTHPDLETGTPVYSIRRYGRFGAFFEPDLEQDVPRTYRFRIVASDAPLDREACAALYADYAGAPGDAAE